MEEILDPREVGRIVYDDIRALVPDTQFVVMEGKIYVKSPGGLTADQRTLIEQGRDALYCYLTIPPAVAGQCWHGHTRQWKISRYGVWVCSCYREKGEL